MAARPRKQARRTWSRLNETDKRAVVALYEAGEHSTKIAERLGISKTMVLSILHAGSVKLRNQPMTDADSAEAKRLYEAGHALSELSELMPFSQEAIRLALISAGVRMRPPRR